MKRKIKGFLFFTITKTEMNYFFDLLPKRLKRKYFFNVFSAIRMSSSVINNTFWFIILFFF